MKEMPPLKARVEPSGDELLDRMVARLVEAYRPQAVYLFGSRGRGDAGPDSDYDLLVVVRDDAPAERRGSRLAYQVLWEIGQSGDIVVMTRSAFASRQKVETSLPGVVLREGNLLYAA